jgi:hypothetical protein
LFLLIAAALFAQAPAQTGTAHITLGQSAVPLYGPWKFTVGDSPVDPKTGKPLWAEPDFDDSQWETVDLTPKDGAIDPVAGVPGYIPGWTAKGHPGYWGYAWYRIRVEVQGHPGEALALAGPENVDDAYQVFSNGVLAGHFGNFTDSKPGVYAAEPKMFRIPGPGSHEATSEPGEAGSGGVGADATGTTGSTQIVAFRIWMEPSTLFSAPDVGGMHSVPVLGEAGAVAAGYQMHWLEIVRTYASDAFLSLLFGLLAVVAFSLILFDRSDKVYLWMGALFLADAVSAALIVTASWTELMNEQVFLLLREILEALVGAAWIMVLRVWFGQQRPVWVPGLTAVLTLLLIVSSILRDEVFFGLVPHEAAVHFATVSLVLNLLLFALLLWIVIEGIRRQGLEGWLVLPVAVLRGISAFQIQLGVLRVRVTWFPFGLQVTLGTFARLLGVGVIALLLLRRLLNSMKRQRQMALDVKQAQEVQQVILPEARLALPGLTVESEYRPAREVGGDFFQIVPHRSDGSVLIVAGDVAGKGLQAGMLVALLVGAIRSTSDWSTDPVVVLRALNQRLIGRSDAQATCLALRIDAAGRATLANAGHMAPYLNGEPMAMEGALPLGIMEEAEFSGLHFQLKPEDKLMLMSDGIAEATDANGRLFGFERVHELLRTATTAAEIALAAQAFGQQDDISVIAVTRTMVLEQVAI